MGEYCSFPKNTDVPVILRPELLERCESGLVNVRLSSGGGGTAAAEQAPQWLRLYQVSATKPTMHVRKVRGLGAACVLSSGSSRAAVRVAEQAPQWLHLRWDGARSCGEGADGDLAGRRFCGNP